MGMFSWKTSDTQKTLVCKAFVQRALSAGVPFTERATLLLPSGEKVTGAYGGYGNLENEDGVSYDVISLLYRELFEPDAPLELCVADHSKRFYEFRDKAFKDDATFQTISANVKIVEDPHLSFDAVCGSEDCPSQGFLF